jgi:ketopantoate reductase
MRFLIAGIARDPGVNGVVRNIMAEVGAVVETGERFGVPVPCTRTVYACTSLLEKTRAKA